jgi:AcrR family transcriptional regulator
MTITALDAITARKPRRADALRNYEALLDAARAAFAEHGTEASLEDIARRAGVGIGTLYRNFPRRSDLIEAVYISEIERLAAASEQSLENRDAWDGLESWLGSFVDYIGTKHVLIDGINREGEVFQNCRRVMYAAGAPVLARAQVDGSARGDITIQDVVRLIAGVAGIAHETDAERDRMVSLAVDGLRAR